MILPRRNFFFSVFSFFLRRYAVSTSSDIISSVLKREKSWSLVPCFFFFFSLTPINFTIYKCVFARRDHPSYHPRPTYPSPVFFFFYFRLFFHSDCSSASFEHHAYRDNLARLHDGPEYICLSISQVSILACGDCSRTSRTVFYFFLSEIGIDIDEASRYCEDIGR